MEVEIGEEVIHRLSENPCPVDGIDSTEMVSRIESFICEKGFDNVLFFFEVSGQLLRKHAIFFYLPDNRRRYL